MGSPFYQSYLFAQAQPGQPAATSEQRSSSFRPVQGGEAMQSGEKLLVEAYAVIWVLLFGMLLFSWRRQRKMDDRIATLEQAVTAARKEAAVRPGKETSEDKEAG